MLDYLKNILPRLAQHSQKLNKIEIFIEKPWIFIDEEGNRHEYIFRRDKQLLIAFNGVVTHGSWELILNNRKLLINRENDSLLLEHGFVDDAVLLLKKSNDQDSVLALINQDKIPDLNVRAYLEEKAQEVEAKALPSAPKLVFKRDQRIHGWPIEIGMRVSSYNNSRLTGEFISAAKNHNYERLIFLKEGKVDSLKYLAPTSYQGIDFKIIQENNIVTVGDQFYKYEQHSLPENTYFEVWSGGKIEKIKIDSDGKVTEVKNDYPLVFAVILVFILIILMLILTVF